MILQDLFEEVLRESQKLSKVENLRENMKLSEMATLRKERSGLPVNIYLDDSGSWSRSGHWKRIKFQPDTNNHPDTRNMIPMSISDDPEILVRDARMSLSSSEIEEIKSFVRNNKEILLKLSDSEIDIQEFIERMRR